MGKSWIIVGLLSLALSFTLEAQNNSKVDSLERIADTHEDPKQQVKALYDLYGIFLYQDPVIAKTYLDRGMELSQANNHLNGIILAYDKYGGLESANGDYQSALEYYQMADSLLQDIEWPREQTLIYGNFAATYKALGQYDQSLEWNEKFIEKAKEIDNQYFVAFGYQLTGDLFHDKGQNELAAMNYLKAVRIYEKSTDIARLGDAFRALGASQTSFQRYEDAQENLEKAIKIYIDLNDQLYLSQAYRDLGLNYFQQEKYAAADDFYKKALFLSQTVADTFGIAQALGNLGEIKYESLQYDSAKYYSLESLRFLEIIGNPYTIGTEYTNLGNAFLKLEAYSEALSAFEKAEALLEPLEVPGSMKFVYLGLSQVYEVDKDYDKALPLYMQYVTISDSMFTVEKVTKLEEVQLIYDVEKKDQEIALLSKDIELGDLRRQLLIVAIGGLALVAGLIIYMQFMRRKKERKIEEERNRRQQAELQKKQLEKDQLERELASQVLQLCRKNELLARVQKEVKELTPEEANNRSDFKRLNRTIQSNLQSDEDWKQFLSTFEKVHPDFLKQIRQSAQSLSPAEQRLACLFRMNLSSKEIATLLNISDQGVKKARYRLRKKLGLPSEVNLQEHLINFRMEQSSV
ncbi:MAG: hypothetical protein Sapg2KO_14630 [Saprospiraceae bacterium]